MTAPMTAAEYRVKADEKWVRSVSDYRDADEPRLLAALEEREALLGERADLITATGKAVNEVTELRKRLALMEVNYSADTRDAEVGALVAKIQRHPKSVAPVVHDGYGLDVFTGALSADGFRSILSHLDSLLPKEPEPKWSGLAPSGGRYRVRGGLLYADDGVEIGQVARVGVEDIPFVAALLEASRGK